MKVLYKGSVDLSTEYNGARFSFVHNQIKDIPSEVYTHIVTSGHINANDLVPYDEPATSVVPEISGFQKRIKELEKENAALRDEIAALKKSEKRGPGRPKER